MASPEPHKPTYDAPNATQRIVRYIVVCLASWAYTKTFLKRDTFDDDNIRDAVDAVSTNETFPFELDFFTRAISRRGNNAADITITGTVQADYISRAILLDPVSTYTKIVRSSVRMNDMTNLFAAFNEYIHRHVYVFPHRLVKKEDTYSFQWYVVKRGSDIMLDNTTKLNLQFARQITRRAKREKAPIPRPHQYTRRTDEIWG